MNYRIIKQDLGHTCRECLCEQHRIRLKPQDCYYQMYPAVCSRCGNVKNIVEDIRFGKRLLIRLKP